MAERLKGWHADHPLADGGLATPHLFGVDIDGDALTALRARWAPDAVNSSAVELALSWGDALTGPGFGDSPTSMADEPPAPDLDWQMAFADVARDGGFDIVIGNPPYRSERSSKQALGRLKASPLGRRWHQPRLDLWAYFLHRGLDVLRPGGRLAFILPSYWTASQAARQLIGRLETEATLCDIILLGNSPVFPNVSGRHLVLHLTKGRREADCRIWDLSASGKAVAKELRRIPQYGEPRRSLKQSDLYRHGQLHLSPPINRHRCHDEASLKPLGEGFEVRQGIVENPRRITRKMADQWGGDYRVGEGVFVLSPEELERLELSPEEMQLLRPYFRGTDIARYAIADRPTEWLMYLTRETASDLKVVPKIEAHLSRFRPLLESRREVRLGRIAWWHLHWPREEALFLNPRIVMPQMGTVPRFAYGETPAFVGFAMHVIRERPGTPTRDSLSLLALTGLLNSQWAAEWFWREAKHRGAALDISGSVLRRFPLPKDNPEMESALTALVQSRLAFGEATDSSAGLETRIDGLVQKWYAGRE
jgi:adenine-specific DNA-methyltransferase